MSFLRDRRKGLTLVELMIVIAIISLISAIAVPAYRNYVLRAQISQVVSYLRGFKTELTEMWASNNSYPEKIVGVEKGAVFEPDVEYIDFMTYNFNGQSSNGGQVFLMVRLDEDLIGVSNHVRRTITLAALVIGNNLVFRCGIYNGEGTTDIPLEALPAGCNTINVSGTLSRLKFLSTL